MDNPRIPDHLRCKRAASNSLASCLGYGRFKELKKKPCDDGNLNIMSRHEHQSEAPRQPVMRLGLKMV